jgi:tetrahydrodipicolinate N-succinyltransferase
VRSVTLTIGAVVGIGAAVGVGVGVGVGGDDVVCDGVVVGTTSETLHVGSDAPLRALGSGKVRLPDTATRVTRNRSSEVIRSHPRSSEVI